MQESKTRVILVSYAKQALEPGSRERQRMKLYAKELPSLHIIIFTEEKEKYPKFQSDENLFLYATNSGSQLGKIFTAIKIGRKILKNDKKSVWTASSQDPFETSLVGRMMCFGNKSTHHLQIHSDIFNKNFISSFTDRLRVAYARYVVKKTSKIRVVSERISKSLQTLGVNPEKITILPIQSDLKDFLAVGEERSYQNSPILSFLYVGRFSPEKNITLLLESFAQLTKQFKDIKLTLSGDGPQKEYLKSKIASLQISDQTTITPWSRDVATLMSQHDVLCLSSWYEGWGMVLVEAAAAGMPVVTTDVGCAGEFVIEGQGGVVVETDNQSQFTEAMKKFIAEKELIKEYGMFNHSKAKAFALPEAEYVKRVVESWSS